MKLIRRTTGLSNDEDRVWRHHLFDNGSTLKVKKFLGDSYYDGVLKISTLKFYYEDLTKEIAINILNTNKDQHLIGIVLNTLNLGLVK